MMKALITGITGQDGSYLTVFLLDTIDIIQALDDPPSSSLYSSFTTYAPLQFCQTSYV